MRLVFYRYRQNFSSGKGPWEYRIYGLVGDDRKIGQDELDEMAEELHREYDWSDKYRGCDIEEVQDPPEDWLRRELESCERTSSARIDISSYLRRMLGEAPLPKRYHHFKGGIYEVVCEAKHSETGETLVIYRSVETLETWARPREMFYGTKDGVPRFTEET